MAALAGRSEYGMDGGHHAALIARAEHVLSSLGRRSQTSRWTAAERKHLAELTESLHENLELLSLDRGPAPADAVTRARARAIVDLVADIGALCHDRGEQSVAEPTTARLLPAPPPLDFGPRVSASPPPARRRDAAAEARAPPAVDVAALSRSGSFEERAVSLNQIAVRERWPTAESARLQALTASVCDNTAKLAQARGTEARGPPSAVARARGRAIDSMLSEMADLFRQHTAATGSEAARAGAEPTRTIDWLRSQASRLVLGPPEPEHVPGPATRTSLAVFSRVVHETPVVAAALEQSARSAPDDEAAVTSAAVRRMGRRHKLAVMRAWHRQLLTRLGAEEAAADAASVAASTEAAVAARAEEARAATEDAEVLQQENAVLLQRLDTLEGIERDASARAQSALANAEDLAKVNAALDASLLKAQAENVAANAATASALGTFAAVQELADQSERQAVGMQRKIEAMEAQVKVEAAAAATALTVASAAQAAEQEVARQRWKTAAEEERIAAVSRCEKAEAAAAELQRQLNDFEVRSRFEADTARRSVTSEEGRLAAQQQASQQVEEAGLKLAESRREIEHAAGEAMSRLQQQLDATSLELAQQRASNADVQTQQERAIAAAERASAEALARDVAKTEQLVAQADAERAKVLAAEQSVAEGRAQLDDLTQTLRQMEEAADELAESKLAVEAHVSALQDVVSANDSLVSTSAERTAACTTAVGDMVELRAHIEEHLQREQEQVRALGHQRAELVATNKALLAQTRELRSQAGRAAETQTEKESAAAEAQVIRERVAQEAEATRERSAQEAEAEREQEHQARMQAVESTVADLEQESRAADERAQVAEAEADRMVERIASLAEMKIQEAERQVQAARERARLKVEDAMRMVAQVEAEVGDLLTEGSMSDLE